MMKNACQRGGEHATRDNLCCLRSYISTQSGRQIKPNSQSVMRRSSSAWWKGNKTGDKLP